MNRYAEFHEHLPGLFTQQQEHMMLSEGEKQTLRKEAYRDASTEFRYQLVPFGNTTLAGLSAADRGLYDRMCANARLDLGWEVVRPPAGLAEEIYSPSARHLRADLFETSRCA